MKKSRLSIKILTGMLAICCVLFISATKLYAQLNLNIIAVNATEEEKSVTVKHILPEELAAEDILNTDQLKLDYDVGKGAYFVYGDFVFAPKQTRTFKILVKDIWQIDREEIDILQGQLEENLVLMEGNEHYDKAVEVKDAFAQRLDQIFAQQVEHADNIELRIETFRANKDELETIREKTFSIEAMETEAKILGDLAQSSVRFFIEVKNPSELDEKTVHHKHYLPKEISAQHVLDKRDFEVRFDAGKGLSFLSKEELFAPGETKRYEILIQDVWNLPETQLSDLEAKAERAFTEISDSAYASTGGYLFDKVKELMSAVRESNTVGASIQEHVGMFRVNERRFDEASANVDKLEEMLAIVRAKKLEDLEKGKVKNVLQKLRALRGLAALSEALFKKGISVTRTWQIIFGTIIFIGVFTTWHFITWQRRSKTMGEEMGLKPGEEMKVVAKPGEEEEDEEEEGEEKKA